MLTEDIATQLLQEPADADPSELLRMREDGVGSLRMVPIRSRSRVVGLFECHLEASTPWRRQQIRAARQVAAVAGPVLENLLRADPPRSDQNVLAPLVDETVGHADPAARPVSCSSLTQAIGRPTPALSSPIMQLPGCRSVE